VLKVISTLGVGYGSMKDGIKWYQIFLKIQFGEKFDALYYHHHSDGWFKSLITNNISEMFEMSNEDMKRHNLDDG
jgi:hypothetical protein